MNWSFRKRITWVNTIAVAILMAVVFACVYAVVHYSSYKHLDDDIEKEKKEILNNLDWNKDEIILRKMPEWDEAEHKQLEANPTFIQIVNKDGEAIFKSANLVGEQFLFNPESKSDYYFNAIANKQRLRFGQFPIVNDSKNLIGHITIAVSQQESYIVLRNLLRVLLFSYLFLLITLFGILWVAASRAIQPVTQLIAAAGNINESSINERLPLPGNKDEIYQLASTINELLERLEVSILKQKQFTADVSHELRTPLTAIKGTLEVLLRRERAPEHYQQKLTDILSETNRLTSLYDEMLTLSKLDAANVVANYEKILLYQFTTKLIENHSTDLLNKKLRVTTNIDETASVYADKSMFEIILNNLISNAIKYNNQNGAVEISWEAPQKKLIVQDSGTGISAEQLPHIFNRFYRANDSRSSEVKGYGLGLSIVKKLCDLQHINVEVKSSEGVGSEFSLCFK